ncbi:protein-serine O-palmitoleoyltransferase porcupine-like [Halichondria panicea]|uniref:protein-serine O-palmitoleoyltransferase porcupine-like n=1 Tax=Halichondria panicea TaxID=6063 RepID=UPI00312B2F74
MDIHWILYSCIVPVTVQGVQISLPLVGISVLLRLCVLWGRLSSGVINTLAALLGVGALWMFYQTGVLYFAVLCLLVYVLLQTLTKHKGAIVAIVCVSFLIICEGYIEQAEVWHRVRGSFLVLVMKVISLSFDLDVTTNKRGERIPPTIAAVPSFDSFVAYCFFPGTLVFGPFVTYTEHSKFLTKSPLSAPWLYSVLRSWLLCLLCLAMSSCVFSFLFPEPAWNKWLAAYSAAASFRFSHYFVSFLSESTVLAAGIGYQTSTTSTHRSSTSYSWSDFAVVRPLFIELPRSLGTVVTNWNLPMHLFLKSYVFKPSISYLGKFGAILCTYIASAVLHGLNFQLAAVLLSIGVYAYIENVLRYRLSVHLNACVMDRPCPINCSHQHKKGSPLAWIVNIFFTLLAMFHLAYLGLMFGAQSHSESELQAKGFSMFHTLRKWSHLNFLSHWVALVSYFIYLLL